MKLFKLIIISIILLLTNVKSSVAQNFGGIANFEIYPQYLINGKLKIETNTTTTTFTYRVQFHKVLNSSWSDGSSLPKWLFTTINVKISSPNSSNVPVFYGNDNFITLADFPSEESAFVWKDFTVTINNSSLVTGKPILLAYISSSMSSAAAYRKSYEFQVGGSVTPPQQPSGYWEGFLLRTSDLKVYSVMGGNARHIEHGVTLAGVYDHSGYIMDMHSHPLPVPLGDLIGGNTSLLRNTNDDKVYFREGSYLRHIPNEDVAVKYHFKIHNNSSNITNVNGLSGYTVGPPIL